jgi:hypothetical protein
VIPPIHTTLTPMDSTDEPTHRCELAIYLGEHKHATTLLSLDTPAACDKCGQELELGREYPVDEKGARHRGKCPKPQPEPELDEAA